MILTGVDSIEEALIRRLERAGIPYAAVLGGVDEALRLADEGYQVMVGSLDDQETFRAARVENAALVATTLSDTTNTNVVFTVREISESVGVIATANSPASVDILELAGCDHVLELGEMLGAALARRVLAPDGRSQVIGQFGDLLIAEAMAPPALAGRPLADSGLRQQLGLTVGGVWDRGHLQVARPETMLNPRSMLVLAGSREQLDAYDLAFGIDQPSNAPVMILGGGRVGRAAARALADASVPYRIVEQQPERVRNPATYVLGDAAEREVLEAAGLNRARAAMITTHDDDVNVYLTIYCRRLRPDMQIIARARLDRNVSTLQRAGADAVLSYSSTGANAIWNVLSSDDTLQLAEGLDVFRVLMPPGLVGTTIAAADVREHTGCTIVAIVRNGKFQVNPAAQQPLPADADLVLIGDSDSEHRFLRRYPNAPRPGRRGTAARSGDR